MLSVVESERNCFALVFYFYTEIQINRSSKFEFLKKCFKQFGFIFGFYFLIAELNQFAITVGATSTAFAKNQISEKLVNASAGFLAKGVKFQRISAMKNFALAAQSACKARFARHRATS